MSFNRRRAAYITFLLAGAAAGQGCGDRAGGLGPYDEIASVTVNASTSHAPVGAVAWVSLTALDASGDTIAIPKVSWASLTPGIASVGPDGAVDAVSTGVAIIEGRAGAFSARAELTLVSGRDEASHDFNDSTIGPYNDRADSHLDFPIDPTGSGRGNVARFHYQGSNGDTNRAIEFRYPRTWGQPIYFKGEFYLPIADLGRTDIIRKLIYWQSHRNFTKYPDGGGLASGRTVVAVSGPDLIVDAVYNPAPSTGKKSDDVRTVETLARGLQGNRWYTLEVHQRMESALGRSDGLLQIWLDGHLLFEKPTMRWADPAWVGTRTSGVPFDASDIYFERFRVGDQVNLNNGAFDEFRYWDNLQFSTRPIGTSQAGG